mmetsp:Transcript_84443/g.243774  ORF Transcript_84443/g.243774 Transcript_84443/m.243774 type:complete len:230 (-) Transcript_84443:28-717(-)
MDAATPSLDDVLRAEGLAEAGEACEHLHLVHHPLELRAAVELHIHSRELDLCPQVIDVSVQVREAFRFDVGWLEDAGAHYVGMERPQLFLHGLAVRLGGQRALHQKLEALREANPGLASGVQDAVLADRFRLLFDDGQPVGVLIAHGFQPREHRRERVGEELLGLHLHVEAKVGEADGLHVLGGRTLLLQRPLVEVRRLAAHFGEGLRRHGAGPMRQRHREAHEVVGEV